MGFKKEEHGEGRLRKNVQDLNEVRTMDFREKVSAEVVEREKSVGE